MSGLKYSVAWAIVMIANTLYESVSCDLANLYHVDILEYRTICLNHSSRTL